MNFKELRLVLEGLDSGSAYWAHGYLAGYHTIKKPELNQYKATLIKAIRKFFPCEEPDLHGCNCKSCQFVRELGLEEEE